VVNSKHELDRGRRHVKRVWEEIWSFRPIRHLSVQKGTTSANVTAMWGLEDLSPGKRYGLKDLAGCADGASAHFGSAQWRSCTGKRPTPSTRLSKVQGKAEKTAST